jgi:hypothetical protein
MNNSNSNDYLPSDLINYELAKYCDLETSIKLHSLDKDTVDNLCIFYLNDYKYNQKITQKVLYQHKYRNLKELNAHCNKKIYDLNHLKKLKKLDCSGDYSGISHENMYGFDINQDSIQDLENLEELNAFDNPNIYDLNHLKKLKKLDCGGYCNITQESIQDLENLEELYACGNNSISDVNNLKKLKILDCSGYYDDGQVSESAINQEGIKKLKNLEELSIAYNSNIHNVNHLKKLKKLDCSGYSCAMKNKGIKKLKNLEELIKCDNYNLQVHREKYYKVIRVKSFEHMSHRDCDRGCKIFVRCNRSGCRNSDDSDDSDYYDDFFGYGGRGRGGY